MPQFLQYLTEATTINLRNIKIPENVWPIVMHQIFLYGKVSEAQNLEVFYALSIGFLGSVVIYATIHDSAV